MRINPRFIRRYQEGGDMSQPVDEGAAAPAGEAPQGQDPIEILALMSAQAIQNQDCNMAMQVCQAFLQIIQQMQSLGGGAPAEEGEPVYAKHGAKLVRRIRK